MTTTPEEKDYIAQVCAEDDAERTKRNRRVTAEIVPVPPAGGEVFVQRYAESCGEGGGVYAISTGDLCDYAHITRLQAERDALKEECLTLACIVEECGKERDTLQSELTKARELLRDINEAPGGSQFRKAIDSFLANQSAPATKIGGEAGGLHLNACVSCSGRFGELKACSNALLGHGYYVECASCGAKTAGYDKAVSAVEHWNGEVKQ